MKLVVTCLAILAASLGTHFTVQAAPQDKESKPPVQVEVADGSLLLKAPGAWQKSKPRVNMIEAEFKILPAEGDKANGRLTIMGAGGSIQANIDRWKGQFKDPGGSGAKNSKVETVEIKGVKVHMVDISGNFMEGMGGPFAPKTEKENYRMLAAIIETPNNGNYFVKLTGPKKTIGAQAKAFKAFIESLEVED